MAQSVRRLPLAQVTISKSWDRAPRQTLQSRCRKINSRSSGTVTTDLWPGCQGDNRKGGEHVQPWLVLPPLPRGVEAGSVAGNLDIA